VAKERIHFVGNVMIDTLVRLLEVATNINDPQITQITQKGEDKNGYALVTLHRPSNVDDPAMLRRIMKTMEEISDELPVIFPIHPRTRQCLHNSQFAIRKPKLHLIDPVGYLEFIALQKQATLVITDSGGIQEETTFLGVPCLTVRQNTERPVTVDLGTNVLVGQDMEKLRTEVYRILDGKTKKGIVPPLWDGRAGERIAEVVTMNKSCNEFALQRNDVQHESTIQNLKSKIP